MTRRPAALEGRAGPQPRVVRGDCLDPASLQEPLAGIDTAYFLAGLVPATQVPGESPCSGGSSGASPGAAASAGNNP